MLSYEYNAEKSEEGEDFIKLSFTYGFENIDIEQYIVKEVQKVYRAQGVDISDKHVEIIVKQMLQKAIVVHEGDTNLLPGTFISRSELYQVMKETLAKGKRIPVVKPVILGITRASLKADSFLSAASFQETTRVLTEAAIRGKIDRLEGLKENIIIGGLIPAGTGLVDSVDVEPENVDATLYDVPKL
jgi:DNA-directed RNA polymerase subunit beta'